MKIKIFTFVLISSSLSAMQPAQLLRNAKEQQLQEGTAQVFQLLQKRNISAEDKKNINNLITEGIFVDQQDTGGNTLLYLATNHNLVDIVKLLLQAHANPNIKNKLNGFPLANAASNNMKEITQLLLQSGANPDLRGVNDSTALIMAVRYADPKKNNNNRETIELLINAKANLDLLNNNKETALNIAVINNNFELVKKLLEAGADPNIEDSKGESALLLAKKNQDLWEYIFEFKRLRRLKQMGRN